jgi:type I restriction enzyme S subunit
VDFEPFKGGRFVDSELGRVPEGWKILSFSSFISPRNEKRDDNISEYAVTNNGILPREEKFKKRLSFAGTKNKIIYKTDLVFGMSREILNWGIMRDSIGSVSAAYNVFSVSGNINSEFLESFIKSHSTYFKDLIKPASREGQGVDKAALFSKSVYLPPDYILVNYYALEKSLCALIQERKNENISLAAIRDTLLPKLMSGELSAAGI